MKIYYRLFFRIYKKAVQRMCYDCQGFIKPGSKILDLGCGTGITTKAFQDFFQTKTLGVDIKDCRVVDIDFKIINGKDLPFNNNEFDIVFLSWVLHHTENSKQLLKEAKRVANRIIIYEDLAPETWLDKIFCRFHLITSHLLFSSLKYFSIEHQYKREKEWEDFFSQLKLKIIFKKRVDHFPLSRLKLGKRICFILEREDV